MKKVIFAITVLGFATVVGFAQSRNLNRTKTKKPNVDSVNGNLKSAPDSTAASGGKADSSATRK
jgi:hypothetical protein